MMSTIVQNGDEDSFIILGTSPGSSLDMKCLENGLETGEVTLDKEQMEEAMKDLSDEANMAFKAHFKLGDCPSPASMMVASTIITDDRSTEELQKRFGELLDENVILKETLKQNNESMKEQFLLIASCQEDMMKTHVLHKEKFEETKGLVEKVIVENEKLTWQKESLEHIVDATSKERDDLKEKLKNAETSISSEEVAKRDQQVHQLEGKIAVLQAELKTAQLKILDLETVKLEFTKLKSGVSEAIRIYKDQIQDLHTRLKEAATTVFQPVRFSISSESENSSSEFASLMSNVKLYDKTLKHLADLLNALTHGMSDSLVQTLGLISSLHDYKLERVTAEQFKSGLTEIKQQMEKQHSVYVSKVYEVLMRPVQSHGGSLRFLPGRLLMLVF
ncbi:hypothetical protein HF086_017842 [Spodoptera exigua]|uniref:Uncharacterized protein n=1 Tax=Spodoptera exigua TaxID=7107 RepID=A0A922SL51_SPOEX|nr:hypothetical protein HF086_017842 [Spodoptera exigua]